MFGVEMNSFLPNQQSNGRDLARQREARHGWFHPSGHASLVEILKRSGGGRRSGGGTLEDILQIVIMVLVQSTDGQDFLGAFQLATHEAVFPTGVSLQRRAAVGPELSLGAKTMRRLQQSDQQSCPNRSDRGN